MTNVPPWVPVTNAVDLKLPSRSAINWSPVKPANSVCMRLDACRQNPAGYLCCARGGQRSHIVQQWLHDSGIDYPLIKGGYKALRRAVIQLTEELVQKPIVLIGGCTGNGKTQLVQQQPNGVDLEGLAHHRGSSFGRTVEPQLSQASFENLLAVEMLKTDSRQDLRLWVLEDEGRMIGANHLPECLRERMARASIAVVDDPFERRLERLREEYFVKMHHDFTHAYGESRGWQEYSEYLHHGLFAIRRRLGLQRFAELTTLLDVALREQQATAAPTPIWAGWCRCSTSITTRCIVISWKRKPRKSFFAAHGRTLPSGLTQSDQCLSRLSARFASQSPST